MLHICFLFYMFHVPCLLLPLFISFRKSPREKKENPKKNERKRRRIHAFNFAFDVVQAERNSRGRQEEEFSVLKRSFHEKILLARERAQG